MTSLEEGWLHDTIKLHLYKLLGKSIPVTGKNGVLTINVERLEFKYTIPLVVESDGYRSSLSLNLESVQASTSLPFSLLVDNNASNCSISAIMHTPRIYNQRAVWTFEISFENYVVMHYAQGQTPFFKSLIAELSGVSLPYDDFEFQPIIYDIVLKAPDMHVLCGANEYNVLLPPSTTLNLDDVSTPLEVRQWQNSYLDFNAEELELKFSIERKEFDQPQSTTQYIIDAASLDVSLVLSSHHTLHLEAPDLLKNLRWKFQRPAFSILTLFHSDIENTDLTDWFEIT